MPISPFSAPSGKPKSGHDLSLFRFVGEVDFVEVLVDLRHATNFWSIKPLLGLNYVLPIEPALSGAATRFHVRIDDPGSWRKLDALMALLDAHYGLSACPMVIKIEVAVDAYHRDQDHGALVAMAANFFRMGHHFSDNTRLVKGKGYRVVGPSFMPPAHTVNKLAAGYVINIGNTTDSISQRIYVKTTDRSGKVDLPKQAHRARMEVTLSGPACPIAALSTGYDFKFQTLSSAFRFRRTSDRLATAPAITRFVFTSAAAPGSRVKRSGRVLYDSRTDADTALNRRTYDALRGLTKKMRA